MFRKIVSVAVLAAVAGVTVSHAQTVSQLGGPSELPPAGFKGQMYVDSRGCVFLRAGLNGAVNWVPRVNRDRKALCGYPPTLATLGKPVPVEPDPVPEADTAPVVATLKPLPPAPKATGKPMDTVASLTTPPKIRAVTPAKPISPELAKALPAPIAPPAAVMMAQAPVVRAPQPVVMAATQGATGNKIGCYSSAPVAQVVALSNGGSAVLCTRGDGSLDGARAPIYAKVAMGEGNRSGAGIYAPGAGAQVAAQVGRAVADPVLLPAVPGVAAVVGVNPATLPDVVVPQGYKLAWEDDRLNPYRGLGTAEGQAAQDQIWTRQVPARLQQQTAQAPVVVVRPQVQVSTKTEPRAVAAKPAAMAVPQPALGGKLYVQVGTFGVPSNADGAKARLRALGLPVGSAQISKGGRALQMVMAGPFADAGAARAALSAARAVGFGDAFIR